MFSTVLSAALLGMESRLVRVEADVSDGLPMFSMVGYLSTQVKEAQDRVRTALKNSGYRLEPKRITVNLAPADLKKSGSGFDLPIAVAMAASYGKIPAERLEKVMIIGELSLNGEVNGINGVLPIVSAAAGQGCRLCIVPRVNILEGAVVQNMDVVGVSSLEETIGYLQGNIHLEPVKADPEKMLHGQAWDYEDFSDVNGQEAVRRAAEIAVSGFHNLLMIGPPGVGKSLIAKRIPGILPPMSFEESMEVSKVYSVAGQLEKNGFLLLKRPFRSPHHTITARAMAGGGNIPYPGEVSLAHNGVLFVCETLCTAN